ncbi:CID domain-containing protein [Artemisia annua]|uniref:CID domain-containing protein n=1 Tax=Artemisia annua TaxID=35608 RepID=A0A2U1MDR2_ARTAN|nr:CID domain-containing protein [Artemisia annua]
MVDLSCWSSNRADAEWTSYLERTNRPPADLEAFTEVTKDSLLGKRHGKGTDFGRAVQEIIDSYDELRKHEQVDGVITLGQTICDTRYYPQGEQMSDGNNGNSVVIKAHLPTTYSRKKHSGTRASAIHGKVPSAQRAKSSCIYQNRTVSSEDVVMNNDRLHSKPREGTQRRNKRASTSPISLMDLVQMQVLKKTVMKL